MRIRKHGVRPALGTLLACDSTVFFGAAFIATTVAIADVGGRVAIVLKRGIPAIGIGVKDGGNRIFQVF